MMTSDELINQTSGKTEYYTPQPIIEAARTCLGGIDLDPASSELANQRVKARRFFTEAENGLQQIWNKTVWMNHPFSRAQNKLWIARLEHFYSSGYVTAACCITFACTSEQWFQPLLRRPQCFLVPRTNYYLPNGKLKKGVTKGSVVTYFGPDLEAFKDAFAKLGVVKV